MNVPVSDGTMVCVPIMGESVPVHEPDAVHELAFVQAYVKTTDCPWAMLAALAEIVAVGKGSSIYHQRHLARDSTECCSDRYRSRSHSSDETANDCRSAR